MKRINPRRRPRSEADINRAIVDSVKLTKALVIQAALDEGAMKPEDVNRVWNRAVSLSESVNKGYCSLKDIYETLKEEYNV